MTDKSHFKIPQIFIGNHKTVEINPQIVVMVSTIPMRTMKWVNGILATGYQNMVSV